MVAVMLDRSAASQQWLAATHGAGAGANKRQITFTSSMESIAINATFVRSQTTMLVRYSA